MANYPMRGQDCEYTLDCMWGVDGWCDRPEGRKCDLAKMDEKKETQNEADAGVQII